MNEMTAIFSKINAFVIKKCADVLKRGGLIIYPTETAYALGGSISNRSAVQKIFRLKKRTKKKGLTAIVPDIKTAKRFGKITKNEEKIIKKYMPGPFTLVVGKKKTFPDIANREFAFRISSNRTAQQIAKKFKGAVVATSANISGKEPVYDSKKIIRMFDGKVDVIIDSGKLPKRKMSRIARIKNRKLIFLRK